MQVPVCGFTDRSNIVAAAQAHVVWKNRLGRLVRADVYPADAALLGQGCQLDNLINGAPFSAFREMDAFWRLKEAHEKFHLLSLQVIEKLNDGDREGAKTLFEDEYSRSFQDIMASLCALSRG